MASDLDPKLTERIVHILKSQGLFDQWRKDCLSFVDSRPAYEHLRDKVNTSVATFLSQQKWSPGLNKNQLRERLRNHIQQETFFESGVTKIIDQIVTPKVYPTIKPQVEEIVYTVLGLKKSPLREEKPKPPPAKAAAQTSTEASNEAGNTSNTNEILKTPMKESSGDSPVSTVSGQISQGTTNNVQDFSESAHLPERRQSPPTTEPFDNFSNLKEKLEQSDPLKPSEPSTQEAKTDGASTQPTNTSGVSTSSSSQKSKAGSSHDNSDNTKASSSETSTSEKRDEKKDHRSNDLSKSKKSSSSRKDSSSSRSKSSKSTKDRNETHSRSKDKKESRSGKSDDSKGSSRKDKDDTHKRESSRSHHRRSHSRTRHSHHSHEKSHSGRSNCRDESSKHRKRSRDRDDGGSSGGPSGTGGTGGTGATDASSSKKDSSKSSNGHKGSGTNAVNNSPVESENAQVPSDKLSTQVAVTCVEGSHSNQALSSGLNRGPSNLEKSPSLKQSFNSSELNIHYNLDESDLQKSPNTAEDRSQFTSFVEECSMSNEIVSSSPKNGEFNSCSNSPRAEAEDDSSVHEETLLDAGQGSQASQDKSLNVEDTVDGESAVNVLSEEELQLLECLSQFQRQVKNKQSIEEADFMGFTSNDLHLSKKKRNFHKKSSSKLVKQIKSQVVDGNLNSNSFDEASCSTCSDGSMLRAISQNGNDQDFDIYSGSLKECSFKTYGYESNSKFSDHYGGSGMSQPKQNQDFSVGRKGHVKVQKSYHRGPLNQRYSDTELYKPRPLISSSSVRRRQTQDKSTSVGESSSDAKSSKPSR